MGDKDGPLRGRPSGDFSFGIFDLPSSCLIPYLLSLISYLLPLIPVTRLIHLCLGLARAILSDTRVRRQWIFISTLVVLGFVFGGYFLALKFLENHPMLFALYLLTSFGGLAFLILFAFFDMLVIHRKYLAARRAAREKLNAPLATPPSETDPPSQQPPPLA
jgi:hypothetical protein